MMGEGTEEREDAEKERNILVPGLADIVEGGRWSSVEHAVKIAGGASTLKSSVSFLLYFFSKETRTVHQF
jgi:hypothetical protein